LGQISIRERDYDQAVRYLHDALAHEPDDAVARTDLAVALRLTGRTAEAEKAVDAAREAMPLLPYVLAEAWRGANQDASRALGGRNAWNKPLPPDVEYYLEIAAWYLRLGDRLSANSVCVSRTINCHPANIRRSSTTTWLISLGGRGRGSERTT